MEESILGQCKGPGAHQAWHTPSKQGGQCRQNEVRQGREEGAEVNKLLGAR